MRINTLLLSLLFFSSCTVYQIPNKDIYGVYERPRSEHIEFFARDSSYSMFLSPDALFPIFHISILEKGKLTYYKPDRSDGPTLVDSMGNLVFQIGNGSWTRNADTLYLQFESFSPLTKYAHLIKTDSLIPINSYRSTWIRNKKE